MTTCSSLFIDDILAVCDEYAVAIPPHLLAQLAALDVPPFPIEPEAFEGFTLPDADGLVELTDNAAWAGHRVQVAEITFSQTGDAKAKALANLTLANGRYYPDTPRAFIGACYEATIDAQGNGVLDESKPIMGSTNWPGKMATDGTSDLSTAAGVLAWCAKVKPAGPNAEAEPFPHPPGPAKKKK